MSLFWWSKLLVLIKSLITSGSGAPFFFPPHFYVSVIYRSLRKTLKAQCMKLIECSSVWSFNVLEFWPCSSDCTYVCSSHIIFKDTTNQSHINNVCVTQPLSCFIFTLHTERVVFLAVLFYVCQQRVPQTIFFLFACTLLCLFCFFFAPTDLMQCIAKFSIF